MKIRVVVPVFNEEKLLPHFLAHYERFADSILVWDNGSTDRTREIAKAHPLVKLMEFRTEGYDEAAVLEVLHQTKGASYGRFDWLMFPDCDEFIRARDPGRERELLEGAPEQVIAADGYCMIATPWDAPIDLARPLIPQRTWGWKSRNYSKPIIIRPTLDGDFCPGKHGIKGLKVDPDDRFLLLHLEMIDFNLLVYRKNRRELSESNKRHDWCTARFCQPLKTHLEYWASGLLMAEDLSKVIG